MSDDEYYYDSPYEDLQDILYDADPAPDLADDLAEHATHSPVWQDDPLAEIQNYFSDWEYYSDDYYDDDPKILQQNPQDGSLRPSKPDKRGRKRKLSELKDSNAFDPKEKESLAKCIRGTVWAQPNAFKTAIYQQGQNNKVALKLSDEIMGSAYSKTRGFGRRRIRRDESWANELSLADMGLQNTQRKSLQHEMSFDEEAEADEELDVGTEVEMQMASENSLELSASGDLTVGNGFAVSPHGTWEDDLETQGIPERAKRRKYEGDDRRSVPSISPRLETKVNEKSEIDSRLKRSSRRKNSVSEDAPQVSADVHANDQDTTLKAGNRKRKLSADESSAISIDKPRQAKRVASSKLHSDQEQTSTKAAPTNRSTRTRKK